MDQQLKMFVFGPCEKVSVERVERVERVAAVACVHAILTSVDGKRCSKRCNHTTQAH